MAEIAVHDCQTFGGMIEGIEEVSSLVARYTELETRILLRTSVTTKQLSAALVKLYTAILQFLVQARRYYGQRTISQFTHSAAYHFLLMTSPQRKDTQKRCSTFPEHHRSTHSSHREV